LSFFVFEEIILDDETGLFDFVVVFLSLGASCACFISRSIQSRAAKKVSYI